MAYDDTYDSKRGRPRKPIGNCRITVHDGGYVMRQDLAKAGVPQPRIEHALDMGMESKYGDRGERKGRPPLLCRLTSKYAKYLFGNESPKFFDRFGRPYELPTTEPAPSSVNIQPKYIASAMQIAVEPRAAEPLVQDRAPMVAVKDASQIVQVAQPQSAQSAPPQPAPEYERPKLDAKTKQRIKNIEEERGKLLPFEDNVDNLLSGTGKSRGDVMDKRFDMMCAGLLYDVGKDRHVYPIKEETTIKFVLRTDRVPLNDVATWCGETDIDKIHKLLKELFIEVDVVPLNGKYYQCVELDHVSEVLERYGKSFLE